MGFNIAFDPSILTVGESGMSSLVDIFSKKSPAALAGNPIEKISANKLLESVAQAARTPKDAAEWAAMGPEGLGEACLRYLEEHQDCFELYGPRPFLQHPGIGGPSGAEAVPFANACPWLASGNGSVVYRSQVLGHEPDEAEKARVLIHLAAGMGFGGKAHGDAKFSLSPNVKKKTPLPGPALGRLGNLHVFLQGRTVLETIWLNLLTMEDIAAAGIFPGGVGVPIWERMPKSEDDAVAKELQKTLMGRLLPCSTFALLDGENIRLTEGVRHADFMTGGMADPSMAVGMVSKTKKGKPEPRVLRADPSRAPWRAVPSLLAWRMSDSGGMECLYLTRGIPRLESIKFGAYGIWAGGMSVSSSSGETLIKPNNGTVESLIQMDTAWTSGGQEGRWLRALKSVMDELQQMEKVLYASTASYGQAVGESPKAASGRAAAACMRFWEEAGRRFPAMSLACLEPGPEARETELSRLRGRAVGIYHDVCGDSCDWLCKRSRIVCVPHFSVKKTDSKKKKPATEKSAA